MTNDKSFLSSEYEFSLSIYESLHFINKKQPIAAILIVAKILFSVTANNRVCWHAQDF